MMTTPKATIYPTGTIFRLPNKTWYWVMDKDGIIKSNNNDGEHLHNTALESYHFYDNKMGFEIIVPKEDLFDKLYERLI